MGKRNKQIRVTLPFDVVEYLKKEASKYNMTLEIYAGLKLSGVKITKDENYKAQRDALIHLYRKSANKTYEEIENDLLDEGIDISFKQINEIVKKFKKPEEEIKSTS